MIVNIEIPELEVYKKGFPQFWLKRFFISSVSPNFQINALATVYIRLVEAAFVEYRLGREKVYEFWNTHDSINLSAMNRAISHFESCIFDAHRAINCYSRIRRHKELPSDLCSLLNDKKPDFIKNNISKTIATIRNEVHHLEDLLMDGRFEQGSPYALYADGPEVPHPTEEKQTIKTIDRLRISDRELLFSELAVWLEEMGDYADKIAGYENKSA